MSTRCERPWPAIDLVELKYCLAFGSSVEEMADFLHRDVEDVRPPDRGRGAGNGKPDALEYRRVCSPPRAVRGLVKGRYPFATLCHSSLLVALVALYKI
jgi:hypothetical protein